MRRRHSSDGSKAIAEGGFRRTNDWQVQEFRRCLGKGSFTIVCLEIIRGKKLAIKTFNEGTMSREPLSQLASKLTSLDHPNIVKVYSVSTRPEQPIKFETEYMKYGTLQSYLQSCHGKSLSANDLGYIAYQVASGMEYVESSKSVHGNMTSNKVLVGDNLVTKISDVGLALTGNPEYRQLKSKNFPFKWSAPEVFKGTFNIKTDVWSFGVLLWVLFTYGQKPYSGMSNEEVERQLRKGYRLKKPASVPENIQRYMSRCWDQDPEKRPSFASLKSDLKSYKSYNKTYFVTCPADCSGCWHVAS